ncbi:hypothetical protein [Bacillus chungangensis]|uniref:DUF4901 domain-containing protein n=1 Tax=Bacillus chungangensis TaxID=587633 RepID=A0ABT9WQ53_9BACI|nr:hypothetical protein [Bacillus chungangensis]MDQ0175406.1 hypothetical protein [Bacillus chungangensis]
MDSRIKELVDLTKEKFGLDAYFLHTWNIYSDKNVMNETDYTLVMEWFPRCIKEQTEDELNPPGTALIELDLKSSRLKSIIFVEGKTFANTITFNSPDSEKAIRWIERETGFTYLEHFQIKNKETEKIMFEACINGIPLSPSGLMELRLDDQGRLTFFSNYGHFLSQKTLNKVKNTLTLDNEYVKQIAYEQCKLLDFPSSKEEKWLPIYALEEIYVAHNKKTLPFDIIGDRHSYINIDMVMEWDDPLQETFKRYPIKFEDNSVTVDQAFSFAPHPDTFPLTKHEQEKATKVVLDFLRMEFPQDTGKWVLNFLHRRDGYIIAGLKQVQDRRVFQKKLKVFIDATSFQAINYMDSNWFLEMYKDYLSPAAKKINKKEAFEKIKTTIELTPVFVYDFEEQHYILCKKIDSSFGVLAHNGELIELDEV